MRMNIPSVSGRKVLSAGLLDRPGHIGRKLCIAVTDVGKIECWGKSGGKDLRAEFQKVVPDNFKKLKFESVSVAKSASRVYMVF